MDTAVAQVTNDLDKASCLHPREEVSYAKEEHWPACSSLYLRHERRSVEIQQ
jgi:hypothetical protein